MKTIKEAVEAAYPGYHPIVAMIDMVAKATKLDENVRAAYQSGDEGEIARIEGDPRYLNADLRLKVHKTVSEYMFPKQKSIEVKMHDASARTLKVITETSNGGENDYHIVDNAKGKPILDLSENHYVENPPDIISDYAPEKLKGRLGNHKKNIERRKREKEAQEVFDALDAVEVDASGNPIDNDDEEWEWVYVDE